MTGLLCKFCGALLEPGMVYCLNCGRAIADSIGDTEPDTVVRPLLPQDITQKQMIHFNRGH